MNRSLSINVFVNSTLINKKLLINILHTVPQLTKTLGIISTNLMTINAKSNGFKEEVHLRLMKK